MKNIKSYKKKNGDTAYQFRAYLGYDPVTEKRIQTTRRGFKTAREAKLAMDKLQSDYNQHGWHQQQYMEVKTLNDLFDFWFENYRLSVKETTADYNKVVYNRYFRDNIGKLNLKRITPALLQKNINEFAKTHAKLGNYKTVLVSPLKYGVRMEIIDSNPFDKVVTPRTIKSRYEDTVNFYTKEELAYFLNCVKQDGSQKKYAYFRLLAYTGMRKSEGLALTWKDFDVENRTIRINKTIYYDPLKHYTVSHEPKTKASKRVVSLDTKTVEELQKWHLEQNKWLFIQGLRGGDDQLIFSNKDNNFCNVGTPGFWMRSIYQRYPQKEIRIHGLRHTHASLLFESGATIKEVQERLGHANSNATLNIYTHVVPSRSEKTGENFARFMEN